MLRRRILLILALFFISFDSPAAAQGPRRITHFEGPAEALPKLQPQPVPTGNMILGGLAGGAVGFFAFGYAGALLADRYADDGSDGWEALGGFAIGAVVGESVLLPLGVHIANRRQGDFATSLLVSAGIAAAGIGLTAAVEDMGIVFLPAIPVAQLISTIAIERKTTQ
jgi:hypothetical protein